MGDLVIPDYVNPIVGIRRWSWLPRERDALYSFAFKALTTWGDGWEAIPEMLINQRGSTPRFAAFRWNFHEVHKSMCIQALKAQELERIGQKELNVTYHPHVKSVPSIDCNCGFYGYTDKEEFKIFYNLNSPHLKSIKHFMGLVEVWGNVVLTTHGFRGEYGRIKALVNPPQEFEITYFVRDAMKRTAHRNNVPFLEWDEVELMSYS